MNALALEFIFIYLMLVYAVMAIPIFVVLGVIVWNWRK